MVEASGPGTQTRESVDTPASDESAPNDDTQDCVVRTTERTAPDVPEVRRETRSPAA